MKSIINKYKITIIAILSLTIMVLNFSLALATYSPINNEELQEESDAFQQASGYSIDDGTGAYQLLATVLQVFLGLLGIIFIYLMVIAGYNYMTAAGDQAKVEKAIDTIQRAIIGLVIIVTAYAITAFIFKNLPGGGP